MPTPRLNLNTVDGVRLELARVYRSMKAGQLDPSVGTKLAFVLVQLAKMIETGMLEKRVEALEERGDFA